MALVLFVLLVVTISECKWLAYLFGDSNDWGSSDVNAFYLQKSVNKDARHVILQVYLVLEKRFYFWKLYIDKLRGRGDKENGESTYMFI